MCWQNVKSVKKAKRTSVFIQLITRTLVGSMSVESVGLSFMMITVWLLAPVAPVEAQLLLVVHVQEVVSER